MEHEIIEIDENTSGVLIKIGAPKELVEQGALAIALNPNSGVTVLTPVEVEGAVQAICNKVKKDWLALIQGYELIAIESAAAQAADQVKAQALAARLSKDLEGK